jgi:ubiquinol-cytochrome c reductase cytochrome c subunit
MLPFVIAGIVALPPSAGRTAYLEQCAACHGADLRGGASAPSIRGVGAATVDFWVSTGRMPAAVPWVEVGHRGLQMPQATANAIVAYVTSVQPGGTPIPVVTTGGDAQRGQTLFRENCMHCHGADASGAAIGDRQWAPSLERASVTQVAEAIRTGPAEMPVFGEAQLSPRDVDDIATYLSDMHAGGGPQGLPVRSSGPVPEGLLGWLAAGFLALLAYAFASGKKKESTT